MLAQRWGFTGIAHRSLERVVWTLAFSCMAKRNDIIQAWT